MRATFYICLFSSKGYYVVTLTEKVCMTELGLTKKKVQKRTQKEIQL